MMEWATTESMPSVTAENITKLQVEGENGYTLTKEVSAADSALQTDEWQVVDADGAAHGGRLCVHSPQPSESCAGSPGDADQRTDPALCSGGRSRGCTD